MTDLLQIPQLQVAIKEFFKIINAEWNPYS